MRVSTTSVRRASVVLSAAVFAVAPAALAQVSGIWNPQHTVSNLFNEPTNWLGGQVPGNGGTTTFSSAIASTSYLAPADTVVLTSSVTLGKIEISTREIFLFTSSLTGSLNVPAGGTTFEITDAQHRTLWSGTFGQHIAAPISGVGPVIKTGGADLAFVSNNFYGGGTVISGGTLWVTNDASLGTAGTSVTLDGGGLGQFPSSNAAFGTIARPITVTANGGTLDARYAFSPVKYNFSGPISGSGTLTLIGTESFTGANPFGGTLRMQVSTNPSNAYSGIGTFAVNPLIGTQNPAVIVSGSTSVMLGGTGTFTGATGLQLAGSFRLDNTVSNVANRLNDSIALTTLGGDLAITNAGTSATVETIGSLDLGTAYTSLSVQPGATAGSAGFNIGTITRSGTNYGTLFLRGAGATNGTITVGTVNDTAGVGGQTGLVGAGGGAGTTTMSVFPWAAGTTDAASGLTSITSPASGLATLVGNVLRPLNATTEVVPLTNSPSGTQNAVLTKTAVIGDVSVNSLAINGATTAVTLTGGTVTIQSGGLLATGNKAITASSGLSSPAGPLYLNVYSLSLATKDIQTTYGVIKSGPGSWTPGTTAYTGETIIEGGTVIATVDVKTDTEDLTLFGSSASPLKFIASASSNTAFQFNNTISLNRDVTLVGAPGALPIYFTAGSNFLSTVTYGGTTINLSTPSTVLSFYFNGTGGEPQTLTSSSRITGPGRVTDNLNSVNAAPYTILTFNGSNDYTGGTTLHLSEYAAGNDSAFGTGTIEISGSAGTAPILAAVGSTVGSPRVIANNILIYQNAAFGGSLGTSPGPVIASTPLKLTGQVDLNGTDVTLIARDSGTEIAGQIINGGIALSGTATSTLLISGSNNTYRGGNQVIAGTLDLSGTTVPGISGSTLTYGNWYITNNTKLIVDNAVPVNTIAGNLELGGSNAVAVNGSGAALFSNITQVSSGGTLTFDRISATFSGINVLGALYAGSGASIGIAGPLVGSTGTIGAVAGGTLTATGGANSSGRILASGTGSRVVLNGTNTFGSITLNGGSTATVASGSSTFGTVFADSTATLGVAAGASVTVTSPINANFLTLSVAPTGSLTFASFTTNGVASLIGSISGGSVNTGTNSASTSSLGVQSGTVTLTGSITGTGSVYANAGSDLNVPVINLPGPYRPGSPFFTPNGQINIAAGGRIDLTSGGTLASLADLVVIAGTTSAYTGFFNLNDNDLVVTTNGYEPTIRAYIKSGLATPGTGLGTTSTIPSTILAEVLNVDGQGGALYPVFDGISVTATATLVKFTYIGDTDLNGYVDGNDLANLFAGMNGGLTGWQNGDNNYDGVVNGTDLSRLITALGAQGAPLGNSGTGGAVPEPSGLALVAPALLSLRRKRRC